MTIFDGETYEAILDRMLARLPSDVDKREGSVAYDMLAPAALELAQAYMEADNVLDFSFADSTYGEYLERRAEERGLSRREAVKATGKVTFRGIDGLEIPTGTRISTIDTEPIYFVTTETGEVINGEVTVAAEAEIGGADGNISVGEIAEYEVTEIYGVMSVTNNTAFSGGADEESDEDLYARYKENVAKPITSGNKYQYESWAKEINGIYAATCYPLWDGPGTVRVVVINTEKRAPSSTLLAEVTAHIEEMRPVTAKVTVEGVKEIPVDVTATITTTGGEASAAITDNITKYLASIAFSESIVRYSQIGNAILDAENVIDYTDLKVNRSVANISLESDEVPVIGSVQIITN